MGRDRQMVGSGQTFTVEPGYTWENLITTNGNGAAIYVYSNGTVNGGGTQENNAVFTGNTSLQTAGAVMNNGSFTLSYATFTGNTAASNAGAVNNAAGTMTLEHVTFTGNTAGGEGGAIRNATGNTLTLTGATFTGNMAKGVAGAVATYGTTTVTTAVFDGNSSSSYGGAAYTNGTVTFKNADFKNNYSVTRGGAVYNVGTISFENVNFSGNTAVERGGALLNSGTATLTSVNFTGNTAGSEGGAINNAAGASVTVTGATFSKNAGIGAIINYGYLTLADVVFDDNGTAFYSLGSGSTVNFAGKVTLGSDIVRHSEAKYFIKSEEFEKAGAAAYYQVIEADSYSQWNVIGSLITVSEPTKYVQVRDGGDLYIKSTAADLSTAIFSADGTATQVVVAGSTFNGNAYDYSQENLATVMGGTIRVYDGQAAPVTSQVSVTSGNGYHVKNGTFQNCVTASYGGAIRNQGGNVSFENVNFTGNTITGSNHGTAISNESGGTVTLQNVTFQNNLGNTAATQGGAIFNNTNGVMTISGATFTGNTSKHGAGIMNVNGSIIMGDVVFDGNSVFGGSGGAIYNNGNNASITITGKITLKTDSDNLNNASGKFFIDADQFDDGDGAYYQVIESAAKSNWYDCNSAISVKQSDKYQKETVGTDLYIRSKTADFSTALISDGGTATEIVVAGNTFDKGVAYDYAMESYAVAWGGTVRVFDGQAAPVESRVALTSGDGYHVKGGTFRNSYFSDTVNYGGVIANDRGSVSFEDVTFSGNSAAFRGGAVGNYSTNAAAVFQDVTFSGNTAVDQGGAIFNYSGSTVTISGATFTDNASKHGGAIMNVNAALVMGDVVFDGNTAAGGSGGALYSNGVNASVTITGKITLKTASDVLHTSNDHNFVIRTADFGEGAYHLVIDAPSFANWSTINARLSVDDTENFKKITVTNGSKVYIQSLDPQYNFGTALFSAGGTASEIVIAGNTYTGGISYDYEMEPYAVAMGGTIRVFDGQMAPVESQVTVDSGMGYHVKNGTFRNSFSTGNGAAVTNSGTASFENVTFTGNSSAKIGGAIYNNGALTLQNVTFTGNSSADIGGAIYNTANHTVTISGATFSRNVGRGGGAIMNYGDITLANVVFDGNTATGGVAGGAAGTGGAIYNLAATATVTLAGKITLATATDTLAALVNATYVIDNEEFGDGAYYQVIESAAKSNWYGCNSAISVKDSEKYEKQEVGNDLYIKSKSVDFSTALFSAGGTATQIVIAGSTFNGLAYDYSQENLATVMGGTIRVFDGQAAPVESGVTLSAGDGYHLKNGIFRNCSSSQNGGAIRNQGGAISFENVTFSGNTTTAGRGTAVSNESGGTAVFKNVVFSNNCGSSAGGVQGGGIYNTGGTVTVSGATFSGNTAHHGAGIMNYGTLVIGDIVFDGNSVFGDGGSGGAIYSLNDGQTNAGVTITGKITLKTDSDVLHTYQSVYTIQTGDSGFGSGAYYLVFDSSSAANWSGLGETYLKISDEAAYEKKTVGTDLYIKSKTADFTTAIFSAGGTASSLEVAGVAISGVGYDFADQSLAKTWGAANFAYDGYTTGAMTVSGGTMTGDKTIAFKNSTIGGLLLGYGEDSILNGDATFAFENVTATGGFRGFGSRSVVNGDISLAVKNSTLGAVYAAYGAATSGTVTISLTGSTVNGNLTPTGSSAVKTTTAFVTELTDSCVTGQLRGTGSSPNITVGSASVTMTDSYAGIIYGTIGNNVSGDVTITLSGSTVANGVLAHPLDDDPYVVGGDVTLTVTGTKTTTVAGGISGMDTITVDTGATLALAGGTVTSTVLDNNGTITVTADSVISLAQGSDLGNLTVADNVNLTINVDNITSGTTYQDVTLGDGATLTVTGTGHGDDDVATRVYYYDVVDASITGTVGGEIDVTVKGESVKAIYGKNAFNNLSDATVSGNGIVLTGGEFTGNQYANGKALEIAGGSVGAKQYFAGGAETTEGAAAFSGEVAVSGTAVTGRGILGGGKLTVSTSGASVVGGTTSVVVSSTGDETLTVERLAGGALISSKSGSFTEARSAQITATFDSFLTITGDDANTTDIAIGGSIVSGTADFTQVGNSTLAVSGGTFSTLAGGSYIGYKLAGVTVTGDTGVILSGGTVTGNIFGGNVSFYNGVNDSLGVTNTSVTIDATSEICFGESSNITAGNSTCETVNKVGTKSITGNATVTLTGNAANMETFTGTIWGDCGKASVYANGKWDDHVAGKSILVFDGFTGELNASRIACFDTYKTTGNTSVTIGSGTNINAKGVSSWEIEFSGQTTAALTFDNSKISGNFYDDDTKTADTIVLTKDETLELAEDGWVVMQSKQSSLFTNIDKASIWLFGEEAEKSQTLDSADINNAGSITWASDSYQLTYAQDTESKYFQLTVSKLA